MEDVDCAIPENLVGKRNALHLFLSYPKEPIVTFSFGRPVLSIGKFRQLQEERILALRGAGLERKASSTGLIAKTG